VPVTGAPLWLSPNASLLAASNLATLTSIYWVLRPWVLTQGATYVLQADCPGFPQVLALGKLVGPDCIRPAVKWLNSQSTHHTS
jgi:hypothetical protein